MRDVSRTELENAIDEWILNEKHRSILRRRLIDGVTYERGSYARGRGRNARRDSRGRYSSEGYSRNEDMAMQIREMMEDAPDERTRQEFQRFLGKLENM